jgi:hypothetical protein
MTTSVPINGDAIARDDDVILIVRRGKIIGVMSEAAQRDVRTLRMTLTRNALDEEFQPLQGVPVEMFQPSTYVE